MEAKRFGTEMRDEMTGRELTRLAGSRVAVFSDDLKNWDASTVSARNKELLHSEVEATLGHILTLGGYDATSLGINYQSHPCATHITEKAIACSRAVAQGGYTVSQAAYEQLYNQSAPNTQEKDEQKTKKHYEQQFPYKQRGQRRITIRTTKTRGFQRHPTTLPRHGRSAQSVQAVRSLPHGTP